MAIPSSTPCFVITNDFLQDSTLGLTLWNLDLSAVCLAAFTTKLRGSTTEAKFATAYVEGTCLAGRVCVLSTLGFGFAI